METKPNIQFQLHRFDFSEDLANELAYFAKVHHYDDRHTFKEAWTSWLKTPDIDHLLTSELSRLKDNGFEGDAMDKMYKSARYYYRNKSKKDVTDDDMIKKKQKDNKYMGFNSSMLQIIDDDILHQLRLCTSNAATTSSSRVPLISQAQAYKQFCETHQREILNEFISLKHKHGELSQNIADKLKKTYKNRFYHNRIEIQAK